MTDVVAWFQQLQKNLDSYSHIAIQGGHHDPKAYPGEATFTIREDEEETLINVLQGEAQRVCTIVSETSELFVGAAALTLLYIDNHRYVRAVKFDRHMAGYLDLRIRSGVPTCMDGARLYHMKYVPVAAMDEATRHCLVRTRYWRLQDAVLGHVSYIMRRVWSGLDHASAQVARPRTEFWIELSDHEQLRNGAPQAIYEAVRRLVLNTMGWTPIAGYLEYRHSFLVIEAPQSKGNDEASDAIEAMDVNRPEPEADEKKEEDMIKVAPIPPVFSLVRRSEEHPPLAQEQMIYSDSLWTERS